MAEKEEKSGDKEKEHSSEQASNYVSPKAQEEPSCEKENPEIESEASNEKVQKSPEQTLFDDILAQSPLSLTKGKRKQKMTRIFQMF
jgi:hypothetical protein